MTRPDAADAETRRLAELQRLAQARAMMEDLAASLPPGAPLRLAIERGPRRKPPRMAKMVIYNNYSAPPSLRVISRPQRAISLPL